MNVTTPIQGFDNWDDARSAYDTSVDNITLNQWLNMWGRLCRGTAGISGKNNAYSRSIGNV